MENHKRDRFNGAFLDYCQSTVVITMVTMRMMKPSIDQKISMVTMRNGLVATIVVGATAGDWGAGSRVFHTDFDGMFVHMVPVDVVQMPGMEVIHVVTVLNPGMPAVFIVGVSVIAVSGAVHKKVLSFASRPTGYANLADLMCGGEPPGIKTGSTLRPRSSVLFSS